MTAIFWALLVVALAAIVGIMAFVKARKAREETAPEYDRTPPQPCVANGHTYRSDGTAWRCAVCGNHVPRLEGELYGPSEDGRVDRRREDR